MFKNISNEELRDIDGGSVIGIIAAIAAIAAEVYSAAEGYHDAKAGVYNRNGKFGE